MSPRRDGWGLTVGTRPAIVHAEERRDRGGQVFLRWWDTRANNWRSQATGIRVRDAHGRLDRAKAAAAQSAAEAKLAYLKAGEPDPLLTGDHVTLADGLARAVDADTGKWPVDSPHRREVERAVAFTMATLGAGFPWVGIRKPELRKVWRAKIREAMRAGHRGYRAAEILVSHLFTLADWLRGDEVIPPAACARWRGWKGDLAADWRATTGGHVDADPARPRHQPEDAAALLAAARDVDPRLWLLLWLGLELRTGQVARCRRSDLNLDAETLVVRGRGKKRGTTVRLTAGQLAAAREALGPDGYLGGLDAEGGDFPLFPAGQLTGGRTGTPHAVARHRTGPTIGRTAIRRWFLDAETRAGIPHQEGRALYGLRRAAVDVAAGLDDEALQEFGGWADDQMPRRVYRDRDRAGARDRAKGPRASIRGETVPEAVTTPAGTGAGTPSGGEG